MFVSTMYKSSGGHGLRLWLIRNLFRVHSPFIIIFIIITIIIINIIMID